MTNSTEINISVLLYQEDGHWIAQGIEFDVTARGNSPPDASRRFFDRIGAELLMSLELGDSAPLAGVPPAPTRFSQMFERAQMAVTTETPPLRVDNSTPRVNSRMKIGELEAA